MPFNIVPKKQAPQTKCPKPKAKAKKAKKAAPAPFGK
jgi:hypothetical protein